MAGRWVARAWLMACSVVAAAHAAQVVIDVQFARDNDIIISAAVLDIEDLAPTRSAPGQDGVISVSRDCKAQVEIKSILKDMTGLLVQGDTVSVVYSCGAWLERAGPDELVRVDADGNSLFVHQGGVMAICGGEGYRLTSGDSLLLGLKMEGSEFRPGPAGFLWPIDGLDRIRGLLATGESEVRE